MVSTRPRRAVRALSRARGVTLLELLVVVAILGVLSAIAAPAFGGLIAGVRARGASSELYTSLVRARSEAIKRNAEVSLVPGTAGQWQGGWRIPDPANGTNIETHGAVPNATVSGPDSVVFLANGRIKGGATPSFDISVSGQAQHRCIKLDLGGRPNQTSAGC